MGRCSPLPGLVTRAFEVEVQCRQGRERKSSFWVFRDRFEPCSSRNQTMLLEPPDELSLLRQLQMTLSGGFRGRVGGIRP
jgi:hypothetical protein